MEIQLKNLKPNPYRDFKALPLDALKVETLKASINETGFWDNVICRPRPGHTKVGWVATGAMIAEYEGDSQHPEHEEIYVGPISYEDDGDLIEIITGITADKDDLEEGYYEQPIFELAYGHHRIEALAQVKGPDFVIDIPVKDLQDPMMLKIMANENLLDFHNDPSTATETVRIVKNFLTDEMDRCESWEVFVEFYKNLFDGEHGFKVAKGKGIGPGPIKAFLGKGWTEHSVREALKTIQGGEQAKRVEKAFKTSNDVNEFRQAAKKHKIPEEKMPEIAKKVAKRVAERKAMSKNNKDSKTVTSGMGSGPLNHRRTMEVIVLQEANGSDEFEATLKDIQIDIELIEADAKRLANKINTLNSHLSDLGATQLNAIEGVFLPTTFKRLVKEAGGLLNYFIKELS